MAFSHKQVYAFLFIICSVLFFFLFTSPFQHGSAAAVDDEKVNLSLYYESLCPYCANFIVNQLGRVFESDLISILNVRLVPWGNTQFAPNNAWICQHGADECIINIVEACAINMLPDLRLRFKFIQCIELLELQGRHNQWHSCMESLKTNPKPMMDCYQTRIGVNLELKYADETNHLNPPHRFVPWVLVDNKPLQEDYRNFVAYVCKAYRGRNRPGSCKPHVLEINSFKETNFSHQVCYPRESKQLAYFTTEVTKDRSAKPQQLGKGTPTSLFISSPHGPSRRP